MAHTNKHNLADYISTEYKKRTGRDISMDKLHREIY